MKNIEIKSIVWKEDKHYVAQCLNVDVSSFGKTEKDALKNLNEALALYFEDTRLSKIKKITSPAIHSSSFKYA